MNAFRYVVSLRFFSAIVAPAEIASRLALEPRYSQQMGEPRRTPKGDLLGGSYSKHYCSFELPHEVDEPLEEMLARVVARLSPSKDLLRKVSDSGGSAEIFIGWFSSRNSGATLSHGLLRSLADLRIDLALDVYVEDRPEEVRGDFPNLRSDCS